MKDIEWIVKNTFIGEIIYITEGAAEHCGLEIELTLPIKPYQAMDFLKAVVEYCEIKNAPIIPDIKITEIFGVPVMFKVMTSLYNHHEEVLRLIFPDNEGLFPDEPGCNYLFMRQVATTQEDLCWMKKEACNYLFFCHNKRFRNSK